MEKVHEAAKTLLELAWWVQRRGPMRAGFEPLPATERVILGYLEGNERSSVTEVGAALDIKPSNVSAAVRELGARGLVERVADPDDKRKSLLSLTDEARRNKGSIDAAVTGSLEEVLEQLPPEHRESLFASLDALGDVVLRLRTADR
jgi:DNA-binding MarR family transcriptional regulator